MEPSAFCEVWKQGKLWMLSCKEQKALGRRQKAENSVLAGAVYRHQAFFCLLLFAFCLLSAGCRRDMQDQPKTIAYRENSFFKDGTGSRPLVEGTVPRGYLRQEREFYTGKKSGAAPKATPQTQTAATQSTSTNATTPYPDDVETIPMLITKTDLDRGQ